ncbi:3'-5' exonuclease [Prevotella sp.]|uniref:3'-5' exonuclease n=1 Tax=Prevotella sp. TaxID=59823 RepID=UPI002F94D34D
MFHPDASQQQVINSQSGFHLVLASPGCGKTQILSERIRLAHAAGVAYDDMLCLTFTNRAARGMRDRVARAIGPESVGRLFIGNVHRFCAKYLFDNGFVAADSSIIDDEDIISIITRYTGEDELTVAQNSRRRREYSLIMQLSHLMYQIAENHPRTLRAHPESLDGADIEAMKIICRVQKMEFTAHTMLDIYHHTDFYRDAVRGEGYDMGEQQAVLTMLRKFGLARCYADYKAQNQLLDFEDLLMIAYTELSRESPANPHYPWIQVDEVQDLNPLQLAIIDLIGPRLDGSEPEGCALYLGDSQQAIFSFMGAKLSMLDVLRRRCEGHVHTLEVNHRSPKYLLDVFNTYAEEILHIDRSLLPTTDYEPVAIGNELQIAPSTVIETEYLDAAQIVARLSHDFPDQTTAVVVNANYDADQISKALLEQRLPHFKVSGDDLFASLEMKTLIAHLNVLASETNFLAWTRLLRGLHVFESNTAARNFVRSLLNRAMLPSDLLLTPGMSYIGRFAETYREQTLVIFDTETTGLDIFHDDIVQIAAVKLVRGERVAGSEFSVYIRTEREIPAMLGDLVNPMIEERRHHELLPPDEALRMFMNYAAGGVLLGHNADYDYHILDHNLRRYLPDCELTAAHPLYFDSLKIARLLLPGQPGYKLKQLLRALSLEGENSHLADDDVNATCGLVDYCYRKAVEIVPQQQAFMAESRVQSRAEVLVRNYRDRYVKSLGQLYTTDLTTALRSFYESLVADGLMGEIDKLPMTLRYMENDLIDGEVEPVMIAQLGRHLVEINTLKEADLCGSSAVSDRVFVSTVHKAKGLEFDNVIIFDAIDDRYPSYFSKGNAHQMAEDARKFYVAMTRAKRRLIVMQSTSRMDYRTRQPVERHLTPFMRPLLKYFSYLQLSPKD